MNPDGGESVDRGRVRGRELAGIAILLLALGAVFTWPLTRHFSSDVLYTHRAAPGYARVPIAQGDHLQLLYMYWLLGDSVREGRSPLEDPYQFRDGSPPGFFFQPSLLPLLTLLLAPLGLVGAYNALTLLSFSAAGVATYLLLRQFVDDRWGALAGALVVALFPFRVAQLAGHANGFLAFLIPLYLYFLERLLSARRWAGWAVAAGATFFFSGAMEYHIVYYLTLFLGLYLPCRLLLPLSAWVATAIPAPDARRTGLLPPLLVALGGGGAGIAAYHAADRVYRFAQPAGWAVTATVTAGLALLLWRSLARAGERHLPAAGGNLATALARPFAAGIPLALAPLGSRFGLPQFGHLLGAGALLGAAALAIPAVRAAAGARLRGDWREQARNRIFRHLVNVALIACTLAFLGMVRGRVFAPSVAGGGRRMSEVSAYSPRPADLFAPGGSAEHMAYPGLIVAALALAGLFALRRIPDPGRRVALGALAAVCIAGFVLAVGPNLEEFPLYHLLFRTVPMFNFPRVAGRILLVGVVGLAALAALGIAALRSRAGRASGVATVMALVLIVADYYPRHTPGLTTLPLSHPVYDRLAQERVQGEVILELPIWPGDTAWSSIYLWYVTRYRQRLLNGYSPAAPHSYVERVFRPLYPLDFGEVRRPQYDLLRRLGIRYLVFHEEAYPPKISEFPFSTALENLRRSPYLEALAAEAPLSLFRLRDPAPEPDDARPGATSPVGSLWEGEQLNREQGRRLEDPTASGAAVAAFPAGAAGLLNRPLPRRVFPTGDYRVRARFASGAGQPFPGLSLIINNPETGAVLAETSNVAGPGQGSPLDLETTYVLEAPTPVSFDIVSNGDAPVRWDFLLVTFAAEPEPRLEFEVEALWNIGRAIADRGASGEAAVELVPGYHPRDFAFTGPDRVLPAGSWAATLRFSGAAGDPATEERFDVAVSNSPRPLASVRLPPPASQPGYQEVTLPFELARSAPVRFRVFFPGARRLVLDRITIARR